MAKMTIEGVTYEGTPEELREIVQTFEAGDATPAIPNFSEGDRVKALVAGEFGDIKAGEYGIIDDLDCGGHTDPYEISVETSDGVYDYFRPQDLELAADSKPECVALKVGDYVVTLENGYALWEYTPGDVLPVVGFRGDGFPIVRAAGRKEEPMNPSQIRKATEAEVAAAVAPAKPKTGDIVVITANTNASHNKVGDVGKVTLVKSHGARVSVSGNEAESGNFTRNSEMRLATPAEIAQYESAVAQTAEDSVFTKAGRKPNEYRKGDIVRVTKSLGGHPVDSIGEVDVAPHYWGGDDRIAVTINGEKRDHSTGVEIVCFAENRADLAKGAC